MSALAGPELEGEESLREVLRRARETFGMESVALKVAPARAATSGTTSSTSAGRPPGEEAPLRFDVPVGPRLRLVGRGPALFAEDQRVLEAFAAAARTAYEGRRAERRGRAGAVARDGRRAADVAAGGGRPRPAHAARRDQGRGQQPAPDRRRVVRRRARRAAGDDRGLGRSPRRRGRQPARREPAAGRGAERPARGRWRSTRSSPARCSRCPTQRTGCRSTCPRTCRWCSADRGLLQRVLVNVLDNALRHGGERASRSRSSPTPAPRAPSSRSSTMGRACRRRARGGTVRAVPAPRRPRARGRRARAVGRARASSRRWTARWSPTTRPGGGLTMRIRLPLARAARTRPSRDDPGPRRRGRARAAQGARDQPAGARLRGERSPRTGARR